MPVLSTVCLLLLFFVVLNHITEKLSTVVFNKVSMRSN